MKILIKFPTRSRPHQFLKVLNLLNEKASDKENISYLITIDNDDPTMTSQFDTSQIKIQNVEIIAGVSNNKIHACNRDIKEYVSGKLTDSYYKTSKFTKSWDIIVLISDDMIPQVEGWDNIIRQAMIKYYPDTDGCLWFYDGYQDRICTLVIMGKKYFDRTNYLYNPAYISLWCDEEQTRVAEKLNRMKYIPICLFKHEHFINNNSVKKDQLYDKNEGYYSLDKRTFERREKNNFGL